MDMHYLGEEFIIHPDRLNTKDSQNYDIGLLKLDRKVNFNMEMSPICLGKPHQVKRNRRNHTNTDKVFISGFGLTLYKKQKTNDDPECSTNKFLPRFVSIIHC